MRSSARFQSGPLGISPSATPNPAMNLLAAAVLQQRVAWQTCLSKPCTGAAARSVLTGTTGTAATCCRRPLGLNSHNQHEQPAAHTASALPQRDSACYLSAQSTITLRSRYLLYCDFGSPAHGQIGNSKGCCHRRNSRVDFRRLGFHHCQCSFGFSADGATKGDFCQTLGLV